MKRTVVLIIGAIALASLSSASATALTRAARASGVFGTITAGPTCPVEQPGQQCESTASHADVWATRHGDSATVASTTSDGNGSYHLALGPGTYDLYAKAGMSCQPVTVTVESGRTSQADISCDTGIR